MRSNRRFVLKSVGAAATGLVGTSETVLGGASGITPEPMALKGTVNDPITTQEVKDLRSEFIRKMSKSDSQPARFGLVKDPTYKKKELVGYGIRFDEQTNSPVEIIRTIPEPIDIAKEIPEFEKRKVNGPIGITRNKEKLKKKIKERIDDGQSRGLRDVEKELHNDINEFARGNSGGI